MTTFAIRLTFALTSDSLRLTSDVLRLGSDACNAISRGLR